MARTGRGLTKRGEPPAVDPFDEPSAEWGWHGNFPRAGRIAGWITVMILLTMLIGHHEGQIENLWLVGIAAVLAYYLIRNGRRARRAWRR